MARYMHKDVLAISAQGRIQGLAKEGGGAPEGYSNKPNS